MRRLLKAGQYEQAFNDALSAEDVDIVIWLCTHLDPAEVLSRQPAKLSQTIILALIQQLGQDLQQDTKTKMAWLHLIDAVDPKAHLQFATTYGNFIR
ncbi:hypothetical protein WJX84_000114 [Apatococcus fuscideae]|uniref:Enhancer of mRNA-decapping protein 4 C-terminal domain-containing protein n=1 Tax=Apatococcus fuscideae TaxID=2026836 RepID=A0AAW1SSZ6_9CHLO